VKHYGMMLAKGVSGRHETRRWHTDAERREALRHDAGNSTLSDEIRHDTTGKLTPSVAKRTATTPTQKEETTEDKIGMACNT
jgi:hypothetical protein